MLVNVMLLKTSAQVNTTHVITEVLEGIYSTVQLSFSFTHAYDVEVHVPLSDGTPVSIPQKTIRLFWCCRWGVTWSLNAERVREMARV